MRAARPASPRPSSVPGSLTAQCYPAPHVQRRSDPQPHSSLCRRALITFPIADGLFRIPIQVSDSLEAIRHSTRTLDAALLEDSVTFSPTTFRPMRYLQARWLLQVVDATDSRTTACSGPFTSRGTP